MKFRKLGFIAIFLLVIAAAVGVVSAQPPPNPPGRPGQPGQWATPDAPATYPTPDLTAFPTPDPNVTPQPGQPFRPPHVRPPTGNTVYVEPTTVYAPAAIPSQTTILDHIVNLVADSLKVLPSDVTTQMSTMSLSEIIAQRGGDVTTVHDQVLIGLFDWISSGVTDGTITQARANIIYDHLTDIVQRALDGSFTTRGTTISGLWG